MVQHESVLTITPDREGEFMIGLKIFDGITESKEDTFKFKTIVLERIYLSENRIIQNEQPGIIDLIYNLKKKLFLFTTDTGDFTPRVENNEPVQNIKWLIEDYKRFKNFISYDLRYHKNSYEHLQAHEYYGLKDTSRVDSIPTLAEFVKRRINVPWFEAKRIGEGFDLSIEAPYQSTRSYKVFLTKKGLRTPVEHLTITNASRYSPFYLYAGTGYLNAAVPNPTSEKDTLQVNAFSFPVGIQVFLTNGFGIGFEHNLLSQELIELRQINPSRRLAFTSFFAIYQPAYMKISKLNVIYSVGAGWFNTGTSKFDLTDYKYVLLAPIFELRLISFMSVIGKIKIGIPIHNLGRPLWNADINLRIAPIF